MNQSAGIAFFTEEAEASCVFDQAKDDLDESFEEGGCDELLFY